MRFQIVVIKQLSRMRQVGNFYRFNLVSTGGFELRSLRCEHTARATKPLLYPAIGTGRETNLQGETNRN